MVGIFHFFHRGEHEYTEVAQRFYRQDAMTQSVAKIYIALLRVLASSRLTLRKLRILLFSAVNPFFQGFVRFLP
jgi:hypothetical protein